MSRLYKKLFYALGGLGGAVVVRNSTRDLAPKFSENVSASLEVGTDLVRVYYTTKTISENVSASLGVTISYTSV